MPRRQSRSKTVRQRIKGTFVYSLQGFMQAENSHGINIGKSAQFDVNLGGMALPPGIPTTLPKILELPELTAWRPDDSTMPRPKGTDTGFYPFAEIGFILFDANGTLEGWARSNNAGYPAIEYNGHFRGHYRFDPPQPLPPMPLGLSGIYTIQIDAKPNHVWDYAFAKVSDDEYAISVAGRLPRLAAGTGVLKRAS